MDNLIKMISEITAKMEAGQHDLKAEMKTEQEAMAAKTDSGFDNVGKTIYNLKNNLRKK